MGYTFKSLCIRNFKYITNNKPLKFDFMNSNNVMMLGSKDTVYMQFLLSFSHLLLNLFWRTQKHCPEGSLSHDPDCLR